MGQVTGQIESIGEKQGTGKTGNPYTMYSVKVNGAWHGAGFDKPAYGEGQVVTFEMVQNGQYQNMKKGSMQLSAGGTPGAIGAGPAPVAQAASGPTPNQMQIMRQNAVTNANAFAAHSGWEGDQAGIIDLAREFLAFYTGELDQAKAENTFNDDVPF